MNNYVLVATLDSKSEAEKLIDSIQSKGMSVQNLGEGVDVGESTTLVTLMIGMEVEEILFARRAIRSCLAEERWESFFLARFDEMSAATWGCKKPPRPFRKAEDAWFERGEAGEFTVWED